MSLPWSEMTSWLSRRKTPLLATHRRPDGDALGAVGGLALALREMGQRPIIALFEPFPARYEFLGIKQDCRAWDAAAGFVRDADALVILDTCSFSQLEPMAGFIGQAPPTLVIDHHATRDDIGGRAGDLRLIDPGASAASLLVAEWLMAESRALTAEQATALLTGLATDCGWFRFSNTDARTLRAAATLIEAG
ncbi:MAG TPA: DHH family phosphoesterase, partial [Phycisphaerae bacterium]|nr:DHH family phosphoesterase [Phycisphaerae bacterium]